MNMMMTSHSWAELRTSSRRIKIMSKNEGVTPKNLEINIFVNTQSIRYMVRIRIIFFYSDHASVIAESNAEV